MHPLRIQRFRGIHPRPPPNNDATQPNNNATQPESSDIPQQPLQPPPYHPSLGDVTAARIILKSFDLPTEIADLVLDLADYHATFSDSRDELVTVEAKQENSNNAGKVYLYTRRMPRPPEGRNLHIKSVTFRTRSHDQGWGGSRGHQGTYKQSYSWFEASILRLDNRLADFPAHGPETEKDIQGLDGPMEKVDWAKLYEETGRTLVESPRSAWEVQQNLVATRTPKEHTVQWTMNGLLEEGDGRGSGESFVETLRPDDRICLWARAKFPGWENKVESASIDISYALT